MFNRVCLAKAHCSYRVILCTPSESFCHHALVFGKKCGNFHRFAFLRIAAVVPMLVIFGYPFFRVSFPFSIYEIISARNSKICQHFTKAVSNFCENYYFNIYLAVHIVKYVSYTGSNIPRVTFDMHYVLVAIGIMERDTCNIYSSRYNV